MPNLGQRLAKLGAAFRPDGGVVVMWRHVDESAEDAKERWQKANPGQDLDSSGLKVIVVGWDRSPPSAGDLS